MIIYDRLYGKIELPAIVEQLLDCPGLLRLRRVGQANIPFARFPSFAYTSRYEHSIGVCYLASIVAKKMGLDKKNQIELMIACLYHDIGTPPFAHATEEVLDDMFSFNHEALLQDLILGRTTDLAKDKTPIYLGRGMHLQRVCQSAKARSHHIDLYRIADIIMGNDKMLSPLVKGKGMDLDNIDNVLRAVTAMGIMDIPKSLPVSLAKSYTLSQGKVVFESEGICDFYTWQDARRNLYNAIFADIEDFSYQAMLKMAIAYWLKQNGGETSCWSLTDEQMLSYLLDNEHSKYLTERFLLLKPYQCYYMLYLTYNNHSQYDTAKRWIKHINHMVNQWNEGIMRKDEKGQPEVLYNYYADKRERCVGVDVIPNGYAVPMMESRGGFYIAFFIKSTISSRGGRAYEKYQSLNQLIQEVINQLSVTLGVDILVEEGRQICSFKNGIK